MALAHSKGTSVHSHNPKAFVGQPNNPKRNARKRSAAAIAEGGCKHHGPGSYHGTSECYIEHPELAPHQPFNVERAKIKAKELRKKYADEKKSKQESAKANVVTNQQQLTSQFSDNKNSSGTAFTATSSQDTEYPGIPDNECTPSAFCISACGCDPSAWMDSETECKPCEDHTDYHNDAFAWMKSKVSDESTQNLSLIHI